MRFNSLVDIFLLYGKNEKLHTNDMSKKGEQIISGRKSRLDT